MKKTRNLTAKKCLLGFILGVAVGAVGCHLFFMSKDFQTPEPERISMKVVVDETGESTYFSAEEVGTACDYSIGYYQVKQVTVNVEGQSYDFIEAIRNGIVSIEEIIAQAKLDSNDPKVCREKFVSDLGTSTFTYRYNDFEIVYRYDVFECADGQMRLLKDFIFAPYGQGHNVSLGFEKETFQSLLYENWGLTFSISDASPNAIRLICEQQDGQQARNLALRGYWIGDQEGNVTIPLIYLENEINLLLNGTTEFDLNFPSEISELSPGSYSIWLQVSEVYTPDDVHPLQKNYCDIQFFGIEFVVE